MGVHGYELTRRHNEKIKTRKQSTEYRSHSLKLKNDRFKWVADLLTLCGRAALALCGRAALVSERAFSNLSCIFGVFRLF